MDLAYIGDLLDTFSTFAGAIGDFLTLPAQILGDVLTFLGVDNSLNGEAPETAPLSSAFEQTSSVFEGSSLSSEADDAE